jgi:hypothetical protein
LFSLYQQLDQQEGAAKMAAFPEKAAAKKLFFVVSLAAGLCHA